MDQNVKIFYFLEILCLTGLKNGFHALCQCECVVRALFTAIPIAFERELGS